ncbi:GNAT family N-acetyltransferase [Deinococcus roseus]|uniref:GNAT family acetyltransferase n=1 Tax=Deinococcus roseus TaxID=392414 RepID=A0ABQ2D936_9DEIO|nr:GNAT family N-acetyltransferase [Deinococcus roseus]GGJ50360.1 GNAT family acetyltransferase [Deinococcus roseus]
MIELQTFRGPEIRGVIPELARLRMQVFRDFPYLYEGSEEYEAHYLQTYLDAPHSLIVVARAQGKVVGASSALPMADEMPEIKAPFLKAGFDLSEVFYLAESVLLPQYRGQGIGVKFFEAREAHAHTLGGFRYATFCAVDRPEDHPLRPVEHVPLDLFWQKRGYQKRPDLHTRLSWRDLGEPEETLKGMTFWLKEL